MRFTAARAALRRSRAARIALLVVAVAAASQIAVWALAPGEEGIDPAAVDAGRWFSEPALKTAADYRDGQFLLALAGLALQAAAVAALALGRPRRVRRGLARLARRPLAGTAAAGALVMVIAGLAVLPTAAIAHERAVDVGLATQSLPEWLGDRGRALAVAAVLGAVGGLALAALVRRWPRRWWIAGSGAVLAYAAATTLFAPVVIAPWFNDFEPLSEGSPLRADVLQLAERADVEVGDVYRVDASRRSTALNAYVAGLGPTKRVVLYDTLIEAADRPALRSVVAHELAHVAHRDIPRGLLFVGIVAPLGLLLVRELGDGIGRRAAAEPGSPAAIPALLLALGVVSFGVNMAGNQLSRQVEASADAFALRVTEDPRALVDLQVALAQRNLSDVDPPWLRTLLFGTHPPPLERIGAAIAWERARG